MTAQAVLQLPDSKIEYLHLFCAGTTLMEAHERLFAVVRDQFPDARIVSVRYQPEEATR